MATNDRHWWVGEIIKFDIEREKTPAFPEVEPSLGDMTGRVIAQIHTIDMGDGRYLIRSGELTVAPPESATSET